MPVRELLMSLAVIPVVNARAEELTVRHQAQASQSGQRLHPVDPGELLALRPAPRVVVDGHLMDSVAQAQDARRDVRLDVKAPPAQDRKSTRLNSSHQIISY